MCYTGTIKLLLVARSFAALLLWSASLLSQTENIPKPQFFAGTVTALNAQQIIVSRIRVGHSPQRRTFLITAKTKMNKAALRLRSRVTVRYRHFPEGDIALEIHLQPPATGPARPT